jgi:hypothetical protein
MAGVRHARLFRNAARCVVQVLALLSLRWTVVPLLVILALESWFAYHRDWRFLRRFGMRAILARLFFSILVPWIVAVNQIYGSFTTKKQTNWQNIKG